MGDFLAYELLPVILNMTLTASVVIVLVLLARLALRRAPRVCSYALWLVVLFRLLCPVSLTADISLMGLLDTPVTEVTAHTSAAAYVPRDVVHAPAPAVELPVPGVGEAVTDALPQGEEQTAADPLEAPMAIATLIWMAGVAAMVIWGAVSLVRLRRRLVGAVPLERGVYLADHIDTPFVLGLFRPKIYLPSALAERERGYILLHERHHIRRLDHAVKLLAFLTLCIHWFNPLVWLMFVLLGRDMEMSCDEAVMKRLGEAVRADYSASLLRLATGRKIIAGAPLAFGEGDTRDRVKNVLQWKRPRLWGVLAGAAVCAVVIAACAVNPNEDIGNEESSTKPVTLSVSDLEDALDALDLAAASMTYHNDTEETYPATAAIRGERYLETLKNLTWNVYKPASGSNENDSFFYRLTAPGLTITAASASYDSGCPLHLVTDSGEGWFVLPLIQNEEDKCTVQESSMTLEIFSSWYEESETASLCRGTGVPLTAEEMDDFQDFTESTRMEYHEEWSGYSDHSTEISCFFTSRYADVRELNFEEFMRYFPGSGEASAQVADAEFEALKQTEGWPYAAVESRDEMPVPIHRFPRSRVDAVLMQYAGITTADLDTAGVTYLAEYDTFYTTTSDFGPGIFILRYGEKNGEIVTLWEDPAHNGSADVLTLRKDGDRWLILSHQSEAIEN